MTKARALADFLNTSASADSDKIVIGDSNDTSLSIPGLGLNTQTAQDAQVIAWNATTGKLEFQEAASGGGVQTFDTVNDLITSGNPAGSLGYVTENKNLYVNAGTGWYSISIVDLDPTISTQLQYSYALATDTTPTTLLLQAADPEGLPITWGFIADSGYQSIANITQQSVDSGEQFIITPLSQDSSNGGFFDVIFTASDGRNVSTKSTIFTLTFGFDWTNPYIEGNTVTYKVTASDLQNNDQFGTAVAISADGNYAVVGSPNEDGGTGDAITDKGAAYVYKKTDGYTWVQEAKLSDPDGGALSHFGNIVDINEDGTRIVVGSYQDPLFYITGSSGDNVYQLYLSTPWDVSTESYNSESFSVAGQEAFPSGISFKTDGTKMYIIGQSDQVNQYSLSTPWDITTAVYDSISFSVLAQESIPTGLLFKPDGTKFFISGTGSGKINQYSLSNPWDISTATYEKQSGAITPSPQDIYVRPDGSTLYIVDNSGIRLYEFSLSTPWDIGATTAVRSTVLSAYESNPLGLFFKPDGTKFYIIGSGGDDVNEFTMSTPWNISTATYTTASTIKPELAPQAIFFKNSYRTLIFERSGSTWSQAAELPGTYDKNTISMSDDGNYIVIMDLYASVYKLDNGSWVLQEIIRPPIRSQRAKLNYDGSVLCIGSTDGDYVFVYERSVDSWSLSDSIQSSDVTVGDEFGSNISISKSGNTIAIAATKVSDPIKKMYIAGPSTDRVYQYTADLSNISNTTYDNVSYSVISEDLNLEGLAFKSDGTKMYISGDTNDSIYQYTLSTPWDISSASYDSVSFSIAAQVLSVSGLFFKPDGTKFYITGTTDIVYQYALSTPWDISTASYDNKSVNVTSQDSTPRNIIFKPDGTKMYLIGTGSDNVVQYSLSTPWDVSTATPDGVTFPSGDATPTAIFFNGAGTRLYIVRDGVNDIIQLNLSTPWDLSTAGASGNTFSIGGQEGSPAGIFIKDLEQFGAVYIFEKDGTGWNQSAKIIPNNPISYIESGYAVDISHDGLYLAVGSLNNEDVAIYKKNTIDNTWTFQSYLYASDPGLADQFGSAVSINSSGDEFVAGSRLADNSGVPDTGSAYMIKTLNTI